MKQHKTNEDCVVINTGKMTAFYKDRKIHYISS